MSDRRTWTIERCDGGGRPGCRDATLVVVDPAGEVAALAEIEGQATSRSVELSVQLVAERPPPVVAGELARAAAQLAAEWGATRMVVHLAPCERLAHDMAESSGLDWRYLANRESACIEVTVPPVVSLRPGDSRIGT